MKFHVWAGSHILKSTELARGLKALSKLGFEHDISAQVAKYAVKGQIPLLPFLAGTDRVKVQEFLKICEDNKANWLLATRGGYGCLRLLKSLDQSQIQRNHPLHVWGYSDLTVLQLYLWQRKGWSYVQGPLLGSDSFVSPHAAEAKVYKNIAKFGVFPSQFKVTPLEKKITLPNGLSFLFLGGNLASLVSMLGTPWEPRPGRDFVLFLEDIDEAAYKCDRLLAQLKSSRFFDTCKGIFLGHFTKCADYQKVFKALAVELRIPVYTGLPMGHQTPRIPLLLGRDVIFDKNTLLYRESQEPGE